MTARRPLERGDVVLVAFPFADLTEARLRPALIVGRVAGDDLVLVFVTSRPPGAAAASECLLAPTDDEFAPTGLRVASTIRLDRLATLDRALVRRRLGHIGPQTATRVAAALRFVFGL